MAEPALVAACVAAMRDRVTIPVTVKNRIGIESGAGASERGLNFTPADEERLHGFIETVAAAGCRVFAVHARKAILIGFSPKDNREVPPLRYDVVRRLKQTFPQLTIVANGGVRNAAQAIDLLTDVDGVMIGREAYHHPYLLAELEQSLNPDSGWQAPPRSVVLAEMARYAAGQVAAGERLHSITRHILGLFAGQPGARSWRRYFSEAGRHDGAGVEVLTRAVEMLEGNVA
jgi:tRNA-dihydrouridine synthase A